MDEIVTLVKKARGGDLDAFGMIVKRFQDMACGYGYSILGDFHLAEDAAQEAFIEAFRNLRLLREPRAFSAWFRKILFKQCDRITRRKRPFTVSLDREIVAEESKGLAEVADRRELREEVLRQVRALPEHQRTATTLFYIDGYSQREVAEFLEVPVTTVKKRLHDSRRKLKERMVEMVSDTLRGKAPDERFSREIISKLLRRPRRSRSRGIRSNGSSWRSGPPFPIT